MWLPLSKHNLRWRGHLNLSMFYNRKVAYISLPCLPYCSAFCISPMENKQILCWTGISGDSGVLVKVEARNLE